MPPRKRTASKKIATKKLPKNYKKKLTTAPLKIDRPDSYKTLEVKWTKGSGFQAKQLVDVKKLPAKLGINQVSNVAKLGIKIDKFGRITVIGQDTIIRTKPGFDPRAASRCTL